MGVIAGVFAMKFNYYFFVFFISIVLILGIIYPVESSSINNEASEIMRTQNFDAARSVSNYYNRNDNVFSNNYLNFTYNNLKNQQKLLSQNELWVDDDFNFSNCNNHTWGVNAFNRIQAAIAMSEMNSTTTINILPGNYYERITIDRPVILKGNSTKLGEILTNISGEIGEKWALICVSANDMGDNDQYQDRDCFPAQGLQAYYTLKNRGYDDDHIILMLWHDDEASSPTYECEPFDNDNGIDEYISIYDGTNNWLNGPDGVFGNTDDPVIDVDNKNVTKKSLEEQINNLSKLVGSNDHMTFYFINHGRINGTPEKSHIYFEDIGNGPNGQYLDSETLDSWLDKINCKRMNIFIDMCRAKNFIKSSQNLTSEPNRLFLGASGGIDNIAHAWYNAGPTHFAGSWYFHHFWNRIGQKENIQDAHRFALYQADRMAEAYPFPYQFPVFIDKIKDSDKYSMVPYVGDMIRILNIPDHYIEISNCSMKGEINRGSSSTSELVSNTCIGLYSESVDVTQTLINDTNIGFINKTQNSSAKDSLVFDFFPTNQSTNNDSFMIGGDKIFSQIFVNLTNDGGGLGGSYIIEFASDRNEWRHLTIQSDNTNNLSKTGNITFIPPIEWSYQAHNHSSMAIGSDYGFWLRLSLLKNYTKIPKGDLIELSYSSNARLIIKDNKITTNEYGLYLHGYNQILSGNYEISDCHIDNNEICSIDKYGIYIWNSKNNKIINNNFKSINWSAVHINGSDSDIINKNDCTNNGYGISILFSSSSSVSDNNCNFNTRRGIFIRGSENIAISDNTCDFNNWSGIHSYNSNNIFIDNNQCNNNDYGVSIYYSEINTIQNNICNYNLKRGIYLSYTNWTKILKNNCSLNNWSGIRLWYSNNNSFINNICDFNQYSGLSFNFSANNIFNNCSINNNKNRDLYLTLRSIDNIMINTSFSTINFANLGSSLIVKNYLHIEVTDLLGAPKADVEISIKDNNRLVYATPGFEGNEPCTDEFGRIQWVLITDCIYHGSIYAEENATLISIKDMDETFWNNERYIEMSESHFEYFFPNSIPTKIILESPGNNSQFNVPSLKFKWKIGFDANNDEIVYTFQLAQFGTYWESLLIENSSLSKDHNWTFCSDFVDGYYQWRVNAFDALQNSTWSDIWNFLIDTIPPSSMINQPKNKQTYNEIDTITGQSMDPNSGSGVNQVEIKIYNMDDQRFWDGNNWILRETWLTVNGNESWSYDPSTINWVTGYNYTIQSRAIDYVNNTEKPGKGIRFFFDSSPPISTIDTPINNSFLSKLNKISGSSVDIGGTDLEKVEIFIKELLHDRYWDGYKWSSEFCWLLVSGTDEWYYNATNTVQWTSDKYYAIGVRAVDIIGNVEICASKITFMYDNVTPSANLEINNNDEFTNINSVKLSLYSNDTGSGIFDLAISNDGINWIKFIEWTEWNEMIGFPTSIDHLLPNKEGLHKVFFRVIDYAKNSVLVNDTIILDSTPPLALSLSINNNNNETNKTSVLLQLYAYDELSGLHQMSFSEDNFIWTDWIDFLNSTFFNLSFGDGEKKVYFRVNDLAGNIAVPINSIIVLNQSWDGPNTNKTDKTNETKENKEEDKSPDYTVYFILAFFILIIILLLIFFKGKTFSTQRAQRKSHDEDEEDDEAEE
jgi:parallel beta-helix repeat protein